jgi:hypothetical protein
MATTAGTTSWENSNLYERIKIRQGQMADERQPLEDDFESIIEVFRPGLTDFEERDPTKIIRDTFNSTPASALRVMADGMQGSTVSRAIAWLRYRIPNQLLKGDDDVNKWLQAIEDHMISVYARSGFYPALGPYYRSALSVGTPAFISEENVSNGRIECTVPHPRENFFRFDAFGEPVQYHRKFQKTIADLVIDLKKENIKFDVMSVDTQSKISSGNHGEKINILQVYYREDDPIFDGENGKQITVSGVNGDILPARPWRTYLLELGADTMTADAAAGRKVPFFALGYWARPHAAWRFEVGTDETYARTPAWYSLHDARGEITASKTLIQSAEEYVRTRLIASRDMRGKIRRKPGSTTYLSTDQSTVKEFPEGNKNYPIAKDERDRIVANVERWFDVPFYTLLQRQLIAGGSPVTATQIIGVEGEQALLRGTRIQRMVNDMLTPIDDRFFSIELNAGRLPEPPDIILDPEFQIERVDAEFIGPLLQAQKKAFAVRRSLEGIGIVKEYAEVWPLVTHKIRAELSLERTLEEIGFDQDAIVDEDEFKDILEALAAKEREAEQMEAAESISGSTERLSKAVEPNSPLAAATE